VLEAFGIQPEGRGVRTLSDEEFDDIRSGRGGADGKAGAGDFGNAFLQLVGGKPGGTGRRFRQDDLGKGSCLLDEDEIR
jgi:hypothetical protein